MKEKREYPRVRGDLEWLFVVQITAEHSSVITETKDISCSGIKCCVDDFFPENKEVEIVLLLPLTEKGLIFEKVKCQAKTIRCVGVRKENKNAYATAFSFIDLKDADRKKIDQYVMHAQEI